MKNEQSSRVASVWVGDDGICRVIHAPDVEVTLQDAQETMAAYRKLNNGKRLPLLIDMKTMRAISRDARHFYASEEAAECACAAAILVGTPVSRVLGNFYIGLSNPYLPSKLFTSEDEALAWLKEFVA